MFNKQETNILNIVVLASEVYEPKACKFWKGIAQKYNLSLRIVPYVEQLIKMLSSSNRPNILIIEDNNLFEGPATISAIGNAGYNGPLIASTWPGSIYDCLSAGADISVPAGCTESFMITSIKKIAVQRGILHNENKDPFHFFLCHSSSDHLFVTKLAPRLACNGYKVWYDEWQLKVGDSIIERIENALKFSSFLVVVLSPESVRSKWVKEELNATLWRQVEEQKCRILPVLRATCDIPIFLKDKYYIDFRTNFAKGFRILINKLPSFDYVFFK